MKGRGSSSGGRSLHTYVTRAHTLDGHPTGRDIGKHCTALVLGLERNPSISLERDRSRQAARPSPNGWGRLVTTPILNAQVRGGLGTGLRPGTTGRMDLVRSSRLSDFSEGGGVLPVLGGFPFPGISQGGGAAWPRTRPPLGLLRGTTSAHSPRGG